MFREVFVHLQEKLVMPQSLFPRRYYIDDEGRRVLTGPPKLGLVFGLEVTSPAALRGPAFFMFCAAQVISAIVTASRSFCKSRYCFWMTASESPRALMANAFWVFMITLPFWIVCTAIAPVCRSSK
jgi:hypothetical protein